ncbi:MAG: iron-containing alcohol dehydrogenase [Planctomycetales bacterium]|nr:iron-containing alcohol dehydrogenase [Planctomycetales bacterium]
MSRRRFNVLATSPPLDTMHAMATTESITSFSFPTQIRFGCGARGALAEFAATCGVERPLLVTDRGLVGTAAYTCAAETMTSVFQDRWHADSGAHSNPLEADVDAAWEAFREHDCDGIVGLGGGSALDVAKALRVKVAFPDESCLDVDRSRWPATMVPMCAIPTTAGTGSEVGRSAVITRASTGVKTLVGGPPLMPNLAILDAALTVGLPPLLTAGTGMDAMTHAVESYVCPMFHPMCDAIALEAIRMVRAYLPRAVADGGDLEARGMMLLAASMGAVAFQKDLGAAHSMAHPLSTEFGAHHGLANAVVLPHVVRFNGEQDDAIYQRVAEALGVDPTGGATAAVADCLDAMNRELGVPAGVRYLAAGGDEIPREGIDRLAELALADVCHATNPRRCTLEDFRRLYQLAW